MLSLVSVYNNAAKLEARLQASLARQNRAHQLICVDNRSGRFGGAAAALNHGAAQAKGDWIVFLHQDVELLGNDWLEWAEALLGRVDPDGWHGVVGRTARGRWRGLLRDRDMVFGEPFDEPIEVQTLDEIVLIHRNQGAGAVYFDEELSGWHAYGVDACCRAVRRGARNYVLPLPVWHDSASTNQAGLREAHRYVWAKHASAFRRVYTTCGVLPHPYGWSGSYKIATLLKSVRGWQHLGWMRLAEGDRFRRSPWEVLEELTAAEPEVHCFHRTARIPAIAGYGFTDRARVRRRIVHHFEGMPGPDMNTECVVIAPDLAPEFRSMSELPPGTKRLIVAVYLDGATASPSCWRKMLGRDFACRLAIEADETRWAVMDLTLQAVGVHAFSAS
jgi:glycosyltransferase involved in cell wall biosynthesis